MTAYTPNTPQWRRRLSSPKTLLGWWSVGLAAVLVVLLILRLILEALADSVPNSLAVLDGIKSFLCALAGGVVGLIAWLRGRERSVLVWFAMLPGLATIVFSIGEFLGKW